MHAGVGVVQYREGYTTEIHRGGRGEAFPGVGEHSEAGEQCTGGSPHQSSASLQAASTNTLTAVECCSPTRWRY